MAAKSIKPEEFGDGGAFPDFHIPQYPLDMGRTKGWTAGSNILPVPVGNIIRYDAIVKQMEYVKNTFDSHHKDLTDLDKHLVGDGRGLEDVEMNDNFAKLSEALYVAEVKAREAVAMRSKVRKENEEKETELREPALERNV